MSEVIQKRKIRRKETMKKRKEKVARETLFIRVVMVSPGEKLYCFDTGIYSQSEMMMMTCQHK